MNQIKVLLLIAFGITVFGFTYQTLRTGSVIDGALWVAATYVGTGIGLGIVTLVRRYVA